MPKFLSLILHSLLCLSLFSGCVNRNKPSELIYFVLGSKESFEISSVNRTFTKENKIKEAISELLAGPNQAEQKKGYRSEIPAGTTLLSFTETPEKIEINLSEEFKSGGGSRSMKVRFEQVNQTLNQFKSKKNIYLLIENKELLILGGEGLEVQSPISSISSKDKEISTSPENNL